MSRRWCVAIGFAAASGLALAACTGEDPNGSGTGIGDGGNAAVPVDGSVAQDAGVSCTTPPRCTDDGASLVTCDSSIMCALGCDVPTARCKLTAPSGAAGKADTAGATASLALDLADTYYVDTSTGVIGLRDEVGQPKGVPVRGPGNGVVAGIGWELVEQSTGAPKVAVFSFRSLTIGKDARVQVVGPEAVALVTQGDLVIGGTLSVRGDCAKGVSGPGAIVKAPPTMGDGIPSVGAPGTAVRTSNSLLICSGGGGGSNGAAGGAGAEASGEVPGGAISSAAGGLPGAARGKTLIDRPLLTGGSVGGDGPTKTVPLAGTGGAGGGAVQLVASGSILVRGTIDAGGCGGRKSFLPGTMLDNFNCIGAGGGGGGGAIFFEAVAVNLTATARVAANGGGGGGGQTTSELLMLHTDGADGTTDAKPAAGGLSEAKYCRCDKAQDGNPAEPNAGYCGRANRPLAASGGGGGIGHIAARTRDSAVIVEDGGIIHPPPTLGYVVVK